MIRPLRRRHAAIMLVVPSVVLPLLVAALLSRPASVPRALPEVPGAVGPLSDRVDLPPMDDLEGVVLSVSGDGSFLDVEVLDYPRSPAVVVRCVGAGTTGATTLGALAKLRRQRFDLAAACREEGSEIVLYSSAHEVELGRSPLPDVVVGGPLP